MNKKYLLLIIIIILIAVAGFFGWKLLYKSPNNPATSSAPSTQTPTSQAQNKTYNIDIKNFAFNPNPLTISKGDIVEWTNKDSVSHLVKGGNFESKLMAQGDVFQFQFNESGNFDYHCAIHPYMQAKIVVK